MGGGGCTKLNKNKMPGSFTHKIIVSASEQLLRVLCACGCLCGVCVCVSVFWRGLRYKSLNLLWTLPGSWLGIAAGLREAKI